MLQSISDIPLCCCSTRLQDIKKNNAKAHNTYNALCASLMQARVSLLCKQFFAIRRSYLPGRYINQCSLPSSNSSSATERSFITGSLTLSTLTTNPPTNFKMASRIVKIQKGEPNNIRGPQCTVQKGVPNNIRGPQCTVQKGEPNNIRGPQCTVQ